MAGWTIERAVVLLILIIAALILLTWLARFAHVL